MKNEEVDAYRFTAAADGPVTCDLVARRLGAKFSHPRVHDASGRLVADSLGTAASDPVLTFAAKKGTQYVVSIHDVDFGGDRSYVYRLAVTQGRASWARSRRQAARRDARVEFVGIGVQTGAAKLESVKRSVAFPAAGASFDYRLIRQWALRRPSRSC